MKWGIKKWFLQRYWKTQLKQQEEVHIKEEAPMVTPSERVESTIFLTESDVTNLDFLLNDNDETQQVLPITSFLYLDFEKLSTDICYGFSLAPFYFF